MVGVTLNQSMPLFAPDGVVQQKQPFECGFIADRSVDVFQKLFSVFKKTVSVYIIHVLILSLENVFITCLIISV